MCGFGIAWAAVRPKSNPCDAMVSCLHHVMLNVQVAQLAATPNSVANTQRMPEAALAPRHGASLPTWITQPRVQRRQEGSDWRVGL